MTDDLALPGDHGEIAPNGLSERDLEELLAGFLEGRSDRTLAAYRADMADFAGFLGVATAREAASMLLGRGHGQANRLALGYRAHLQGRGLSPATTNRRIAALRSLVKMARTFGLVPWTLEVPNLRSEALRDTRGPGTAPIRTALAGLAADGSKRALRDLAMVRLMADLALRVGSVVTLDLAHFDLKRGTILVQLKGRGSERKLKTLPSQTRAALAAWLAVRGSEPGPLFTNFDHARKGAQGGQRLTARSVGRITTALGLGRPHGIRHTSITIATGEAARQGLPMTTVLPFSDHASAATLQGYVDRGADRAGALAQTVADRMTTGRTTRVSARPKRFRREPAAK